MFHLAQVHVVKAWLGISSMPTVLPAYRSGVEQVHKSASYFCLAYLVLLLIFFRYAVFRLYLIID